jgi:hypothetical protein
MALLKCDVSTPAIPHIYEARVLALPRHWCIFSETLSPETLSLDVRGRDVRDLRLRFPAIN